MALRALVGISDTIQEFEGARVDRYWDAVACALERRYFGAAYLLGYAVEMLLKVSYFRFLGVGLADDLRAHLKSARHKAHGRGAQNLHDITFWADMLIGERVARSNPMDTLIASDLRLNTAEVASNWWEAFRYRRSLPAEGEFHRLLELADWFETHQRTFWS